MAQHGASEVLRAIDAVIRGRVLVFGTLPPAGRDIDLLVRPSEASTISATLREAGFSRTGRIWVAFRGCSVTAVELIPHETLRLPEGELEALFREGVPLGGLSRIVEPSPHHALLILSRRVRREARGLSEKHRARIDQAVHLDPDAWTRAHTRAASWRAAEALTAVESLYRGGPKRVARRRRLRRPRRTHVIAFAGPDGMQTSRHARTLAATLERLGMDALVRPGAPGVSATRVVSMWLPILRRLGRGCVVVYEVFPSGRDMLGDAGGTGSTAVRAARMLRALLPRPLRTYVLAEPEQQATGGDSTSSRRSRREHAAGSMSATLVLDRGRSDEELCEEIAADAWRALTRRSALVTLIRATGGLARRRNAS